MAASSEKSNEQEVIETIRSWHARSKVDYFELYVQLYISYNAWYRQVTGASSDHEALLQIKRRIVIWDEYSRGHTLCRLVEPFGDVVRLTRRHPLKEGSTWSGVVHDSRDWRGLINFWHRVRCDVIHGVVSPGDYLAQKYVRVAYRTLSIFMDEILLRMARACSATDVARLTELSSLALQPEGLSGEQYYEKRLLERRFLYAPSISEVDMVRSTQNNPLLETKNGL